MLLPRRKLKERGLSVLNQAAQGCASKLGWNVTRDRASFLAKSLPSWQPFPDTKPTLERLASDFHLGILSNVDDDLLLETLEHLTVSFGMIVTAEEIGSYKPGRAHFDEAIRWPCGIANNKSQIKNLRSVIASEASSQPRVTFTTSVRHWSSIFPWHGSTESRRPFREGYPHRVT